MLYNASVDQSTVSILKPTSLPRSERLELHATKLTTSTKSKPRFSDRPFGSRVCTAAVQIRSPRLRILWYSFGKPKWAVFPLLCKFSPARFIGFGTGRSRRAVL